VSGRSRVRMQTEIIRSGKNHRCEEDADLSTEASRDLPEVIATVGKHKN